MGALQVGVCLLFWSVCYTTAQFGRKTVLPSRKPCWPLKQVYKCTLIISRLLLSVRLHLRLRLNLIFTGFGKQPWSILQVTVRKYTTCNVLFFTVSVKKNLCSCDWAQIKPNSLFFFSAQNQTGAMLLLHHPTEYFCKANQYRCCVSSHLPLLYQSSCNIER